MRRRGIPEDVAMKTALEVAAVKAQVQAIIRRLRTDLNELESSVGQLPGEEGGDDDERVDGTGEADGSGPGGAAR